MRKLTTAVLFAMLSLPLVTSAQTLSTAALQAQAAALLQQVTQLQAQYAASGGGTSAAATTQSSAASSQVCPTVTRRLRLGMSGSDVSQLQTFLAQNPAIYPEGQVTGYFGLHTQAAVQRWQTKFGVVSSGSPASTGWGVVGPHTASAMALSCSTGGGSGTVNQGQAQYQNQTQNPNQSQNPAGTNVNGTNNTNNTNPAVVQPPIGGTIQVTPISGTAPLTVSATATLNTYSSCVAAVYVLNFGDGSPSIAVPVQQNSCQPVTQVFVHTYQTGGSYVVVLAAGGHETTANVTIANAPPTVATSTIVLPPDTLVPSITTGTAPLTVVFTGDVSSISGSGCSTSCSNTIEFGDGGIGLVPLPLTAGSWQSYSISHAYTTAGTYPVTMLSATGTTEIGPISITVNPVITPSFVASPLAGAGSLNVTFKGIVPGNSGYMIDFGDGSAPFATSSAVVACPSGQICSQPLSQVVSQQHNYTTAGTYVATLTSGGVTMGTATITVNPAAPTIAAAFAANPTLGNAPLAVGFTATVPGNNGYLLTYGDNSTPLSTPPATCPTGQICTSQLVNVSHTYSKTGIFYASLTSAGTTIGAATINVSPSIVATFGVTPSSGAAPLAVSFSGVSPGDYGYAVNFGDGTSPQQVPAAPISCPVGQSCSGPVSQTVSVNHTYTAGGTYTATLTSNGNTLGTATINATAAISTADYAVLYVTPSALSVSAIIVLPSCSSSYQIDWGDGTAIVTQTPTCTTSGVVTFTAQHTYNGSGTYNIALKDGNGTTHSTQQVTVTHN